MVNFLSLFICIWTLIHNASATGPDVSDSLSLPVPQFHTIVNWTLPQRIRTIQTMPVVDFVNRTWIQVETETLSNPRLAGNFTLIELKQAPFDLIKKFQDNTNARTIINKFSDYKYNLGLAETFTYKLTQLLGAWSQSYIYTGFRYIDIGVDFIAKFIKSAIRLAKSYDCGGEIVEYIVEGEESSWLVYVGTWTLGETCNIAATNQLINNNIQAWIKEEKEKKGDNIESFTIKVDHNSGIWFSDIKFAKRDALKYPWLIPNLHIPTKYV